VRCKFHTERADASHRKKSVTTKAHAYELPSLAVIGKGKSDGWLFFPHDRDAAALVLATGAAGSAAGAAVGAVAAAAAATAVLLQSCLRVNDNHFKTRNLDAIVFTVSPS